MRWFLVLISLWCHCTVAKPFKCFVESDQGTYHVIHVKNGSPDDHEAIISAKIKIRSTLSIHTILECKHINERFRFKTARRLERLRRQ